MTAVTMLAASADVQSKDIIAPIAAVCGAAIAAFVAWFNARKTPADRLQALLAIYREWPEDSGKKELEALICGQLGEMWHRLPHSDVDADATSCSGIRTASTQHLVADIIACLISTGAVIASACFTWPIDQAQDVEIIFASLVGGFALVVAATRGVRIVRHWM
ncbi:hypothetical protein [Mycobacterium sp. BK086]|uniref:hypothetical protein n=1 Tax=Mycobacterium sp. BK086 TaxID=2512165 RepID=UPI00105070C0|nr:hypothetical protein [Mycobacterium sp. BK086]